MIDSFKRHRIIFVPWIDVGLNNKVRTVCSKQQTIVGIQVSDSGCKRR